MWSRRVNLVLVIIPSVGLFLPQVIIFQQLAWTFG
jgi:hypothetical protein